MLHFFASEGLTKYANTTLSKINAFRGVEDAFVTKLTFDSATSALFLAYSTYFGGSGSKQTGDGKIQLW